MTKKEKTETTIKSPMKLLQTIPESTEASTQEEESGESLIDEKAVVVYHHGSLGGTRKFRKLLRWSREKPRPRRLPQKSKMSSQQQKDLPLPSQTFRSLYNKIVGLIGYVLLFCVDEAPKQKIRDFLFTAAWGEKVARETALQDLKSLLDRLEGCNRRQDISLPFSFEYLGGTYEDEIQDYEDTQWKYLLNEIKHAIYGFARSKYQREYGIIRRSRMSREIDTAITIAQDVSEKYQNLNPWRPQEPTHVLDDNDMSTDNTDCDGSSVTPGAEIAAKESREQGAQYSPVGRRADEFGRDEGVPSRLNDPPAQNNIQEDVSTNPGLRASKTDWIEGEEQSSARHVSVPQAVNDESKETLPDDIVDDAPTTMQSMQQPSSVDRGSTMGDSKPPTQSMSQPSHEETEETTIDNPNPATAQSMRQSSSEETIEDSKSTTPSMDEADSTSEEAGKTFKDIKSSPVVQTTPSNEESEASDINSMLSALGGLGEDRSELKIGNSLSTDDIAKESTGSHQYAKEEEKVQDDTTSGPLASSKQQDFTEGTTTNTEHEDEVVLRQVDEASSESLQTQTKEPEDSNQDATQSGAGTGKGCCCRIA